MRLGIGTYACTWAIGVPGHPAPAQAMNAHCFLDWAAELGLGVVQIADNLPLDSLSWTELQDLVRHADSAGITIEVGTRGIEPSHIRNYLGIARECRSPLLRVVVDSAQHHPSADEVVQILRCELPEFESSGVILAIENHDRLTSRVLVRILHQLQSDFVGVCLDTVNSFGALEGPEVVVTTLAPWVVNLHLKDFQVRRASHLMGFQVEGCPAGQGQLNIAWLMSKLREQRRDPNAIIELWPSPEESIEETIEKERSWARSSVEYLRALIPD